MKQLDRKITVFMQYTVGNPILNKIMRFFTFLGDYCFIWIIITLFIYFYGEKKATYLIIITMLITNAINNGLIKSVFRRKRPFEEYDDITIFIKEPYGSSFPSGHSATGFCAAVIIVWFYPSLGIGALVLATLIAFSRLYLRVHYFSDVLVGSLIGSVCSILLLLYTSR